MPRKRKADQEPREAKRSGRRSEDQQVDADPAERKDADIVRENGVDIVIDGEDGQAGNLRRENWAALARRYSLSPSCLHSQTSSRQC
jgi:hypothetical protein